MYGGPAHARHLPPRRTSARWVDGWRCARDARATASRSAGAGQRRTKWPFM